MTQLSIQQALDLAWARAVPAVKLFLARDSRLSPLAFIPVQYSLIDANAIGAWRSDGWQGKKRFNWAANQQQARDHDPRFELALWSGGTLCGLAFGLPAKPIEAQGMGVGGGLFDLIDLEAPDDHPLKGAVAPYVVMTLLTFAYVLGFEAVRAKNPVNDAVRSLYCALGMHICEDHPARHCFRRIP